MKTSLYTCLKGIAIILAMLFTTPSKAQTSIDMYAFDSTFSYCPLPVNAYIYAYGTTSGYNYLTDNMTIHAYFGDGTDTTFNQFLYDGGTLQYFYATIPHTYTLPGTYTIIVIATGPDGNDDTSSHMITVSNSCGNITGTAYIDNNSNCIFDTGDDTLHWGQFTLTNGSGAYIGTYYTDYNGSYSMSLPTGSSFGIAYNNTYSAGLTPTCPASGAVTFTVSGSANYDFALTCAPGFDLAATGSAWGAVPGQVGYLYLNASNAFCTPTSGTICITLDPQTTFAGSGWGTPPSTISGSTLCWNFTNLAFDYNWWYNYFATNALFMVDTTATIGDSVCFTVDVTPTSGDADVSNNTYHFCIPILASWDPNMKEVSPAGIGATGDVLPNTEFEYTVHFQNTGSFQAFDIYILDTIDTDLDIETFEILASSHDMWPQIINGNILKFNFDNINLPDSTSNEPESHGWVKYRVKTKSGLTEGTQITNTAHIFFDYNPAVVTNTTLNTINSFTSTIEVNNTTNEFSLFPNPSASHVTIQFAESVNSNVYFIDATGKVVLTSMVQGNQTTVSAEGLANGIYQVVVPGAGKQAVRFQKIK